MPVPYCTIPGCRNSLWLEIHHIVHRADGGSNDPSNLTVLCGTHHRAHHNGYIVIAGTGGAITVTHDDGAPYGQCSALPA